MHALQDHAGRVFAAVAAYRLVPLYFLDPLQVDYGRDADKHVNVPGYVHLISYQASLILVVPAPDEPVTAMMGCFFDMMIHFNEKTLTLQG